jgi:hypothetical protein
LLDHYKPQFVCLSEIWRPFGPRKILKGYHPIVAKMRPTGILGGGVAIFISDKVQFKVLNEISNLNLKTMRVAIEATLKNKNEVIESNENERKEYFQRKNNELNDLVSKLVSLNEY